MDVLNVVILSLVLQAQAPQLPKAAEGDFVIRNFTFNSGETLPELRGFSH